MSTDLTTPLPYDKHNYMDLIKQASQKIADRLKNKDFYQPYPFYKQIIVEYEKNSLNIEGDQIWCSIYQDC